MREAELGKFGGKAKPEVNFLSLPTRVDDGGYLKQ